MKNPWLLSVVGSLVASGCVMVEADLPHVCIEEKDLVIPIPVDELDPETLEQLDLALSDRVGGESKVIAARAQTIAPELLAELPPIEVEHAFSPDGIDAIPRAIEDMGADGQLRLLSVQFGAEPATFAGLRRVALSIRPQPEASPTEIAVCDIGEGCAVEGDRLVLRVASETDLLPLLESEDAEFIVELFAKPTAEAWELDLEVCMQAAVEMQLAL